MKYGPLKKSLHKEFESNYRGSSTETKKTSCKNFTIIPKSLCSRNLFNRRITILPDPVSSGNKSEEKYCNELKNNTKYGQLKNLCIKDLRAVIEAVLQKPKKYLVRILQ